MRKAVIALLSMILMAAGGSVAIAITDIATKKRTERHYAELVKELETSLSREVAERAKLQGQINANPAPVAPPQKECPAVPVVAEPKPVAPQIRTATVYLKAKPISCVKHEGVCSLIGCYDE